MSLYTHLHFSFQYNGDNVSNSNLTISTLQSLVNMLTDCYSLHVKDKLVIVYRYQLVQKWTSKNSTKLHTLFSQYVLNHMWISKVNRQMTVALKSRVQQYWNLYDMHSAVVTRTFNKEGLLHWILPFSCISLPWMVQFSGLPKLTYQ